MDPTTNPAAQSATTTSNERDSAPRAAEHSIVRQQDVFQDQINDSGKKLPHHLELTVFPPALQNGAEIDIENGSTPSPQPSVARVDLEDDFPEGGLTAWLVVLSAFLTLFPSFGFMVSIGTLQAYWHTHQLSGYTPRDVGWIPSVFVYLALAGGIFVGPLFDRYGPKWIAAGGSVGYIVMMFLVSPARGVALSEHGGVRIASWRVCGFGRVALNMWNPLVSDSANILVLL